MGGSSKFQDVETGGGDQQQTKHFRLDTDVLCEIMKERNPEGLQKLTYTYEGVSGIANTLGVDIQKG